MRKDDKVTLVGGMAPRAAGFAKYLKRAHGACPKDVWKTQIVTLGSVPGINTRYRLALRAQLEPHRVMQTYLPRQSFAAKMLLPPATLCAREAKSRQNPTYRSNSGKYPR